ncbi:MAG: hypothetical protein ACFFCQ_07840 [Promethearchaeota archaeon]
MVSISSKKAIIERTKAFLEKEELWQATDSEIGFQKISEFLKNEYNIIPEKERIGKGRVYIAKAITEGCFKLLNDKTNLDFIDYTSRIFEYAEDTNDNHLTNFALILLAESVTITEEALKKGLEKTKEYAIRPEWEIRETAGYTIRKGLKKFPEQTLRILREWLALTENENIRRIVAESCRPLRNIKWIREPEKNDPILEILSTMRADPSEYVRKSVGNNLKDLTKYMPEKILKLVKEWITETKIIVTSDLASKTKKELGTENFYLIWTVKHALRWLKARNPEYHPRIEQILGRNYVLYYDEKKNVRSLPK